MAEQMIADVEASGIYEIRNLINGKRYIGSATCFRKRWAGHKSGFKNGNHPNRYLMASWTKYGPDAFVFGIIEVCAIDELIRREQYWIDSGQPEYNLSPTAGNNTGVKFSEEAKRKISKRNKGNKYSLGREISELTRRRISEANKGKTKGIKQSPERIAARAAAHRGMKRSDETKRKISESRKGKKLLVPRSAEYRAKISAIHKGRILDPIHMASFQEGRRNRVWTEEQRTAAAMVTKKRYETGGLSRERSAEYREKIAESLRGRTLPQEVKDKIRATQTGRTRGPYGPKPLEYRKAMCQLNDDQVLEILNLRISGMSQYQISDKTGVKRQLIQQICIRKRYEWVAPELVIPTFRCNPWCDQEFKAKMKSTHKERWRKTKIKITS